MKAEDILPGMRLVLKKERQIAYGNESDIVVVEKIAQRANYKTPWVVERREWQDAQGYTYPRAFYKPSDFSGKARCL